MALLLGHPGQLNDGALRCASAVRIHDLQLTAGPKLDGYKPSSYIWNSMEYPLVN